MVKLGENSDFLMYSVQQSFAMMEMMKPEHCVCEGNYFNKGRSHVFFCTRLFKIWFLEFAGVKSPGATKRNKNLFMITLTV